VRLATYNVENMFDRPKAMNLDTWAEGRQVLADFARLNELIQEPVYTATMKAEMLTILAQHPGLRTQGESRFMFYRQIRGTLANKTTPARITANGRGDWIGWFELKTEAVKATATENTARIVGLVNADVLCVVEAEDRIALKHFNEHVFPRVGVAAYDHIMLIDGNDDRGIDIGVMTRQQFPITRIVSHVDDVDGTGEIFSRDCAEYQIETPNGNTLLVLVNHFKSKGFGVPAASAAKRLRQATRVRAIYEQRLVDGYTHIAVAGDLNETPDQVPMDPLIRQGSTLTDVMVHPNFVGDGRPGTFANGTASNKLDYILMSPALSAAVTSCGIERRGVWGGVNGTLFPHLPEMLVKTDAASDHAALFIDASI
jgi:endonuclease/exonuclease/phosphatase family metal-dependent hydrolase